jgi:hypothetical protein
MPLVPRVVAELSGVRRHPALQVTAVKDISKEETMQDLIQEFMSQKKFAIVGATADTRKYGNEIFKNLKSILWCRHR